MRILPFVLPFVLPFDVVLAIFLGLRSPLLMNSEDGSLRRGVACFTRAIVYVLWRKKRRGHLQEETGRLYIAEGKKNSMKWIEKCGLCFLKIFINYVSARWHQFEEQPCLPCHFWHPPRRCDLAINKVSRTFNAPGVLVIDNNNNSP